MPAEVAPDVRGDEQALSLWEFRDDDGRRIGLRVLLAPATRGSRSRARDEPRCHFSRELRAGRDVDPGEPVAFRRRNAGWKWDPADALTRPDGARPRARGADRGARRAGGADARRPHRRGDAAAVGRDVRRRRAASSGRSTASTWRLGDARVSLRAVPRRDRHAAAGAGRATRRSRRDASAATSTARCSSRARRSTCRSRSTARSSRPATGTARRATARSRARRSSARSSARS